MDIKELNIFSQSLSQIRHPWEIARANLVEYLLVPILSQTASSELVLDIGCGDGYILSRLASKCPSLNYTGVDSAFTADRIKKITEDHPLGNISFCSDLAEVNVSSKAPFLALLLDVLEHVPNDSALLKEAASIVREKGYLLITVPAYQKLYNSHDRWLGHYRRYTLTDLRPMIERVGLKIVFSSYVFSSLVFLRFCSKLAERLHRSADKPQQGIGQWKYGKTAGRILSKLLYINGLCDMLFSRANVPQMGLSVFALCQK